MSGDGERFDASYYRRFYRDAPVHDRRRIGRLAEGVLGFAGWWELPVRSVLDVGAGPGFWRDWMTENRPKVRYRSVDVSEYACSRYGHENRDISRWRPSRPYDLVVCQGVLQYLDDGAAASAVANLAAATRHLLYLEVPTRADLRGVLDTERTDLDVHWREGRWYRAQLAPHFVSVGAGLHVARAAPVHLYELELGGS
ncbi:MAG TPA: class I SAM-dependent methyltransferase [Acidimicrobiales bacterium]